MINCRLRPSKKIREKYFAGETGKLKRFGYLWEMHCLMLYSRDCEYGNDTLSDGLLIYSMVGERKKIVNDVASGFN